MATAGGLRRAMRGLSEAEFRERFGTEEACRQALFEMRWREGLTCPGCGGSSFCRLKTRRLFQCNRCKKQVRLTAGTVLQDSKLPLTAWFAAIYHLTQAKKGISSIELGRRLGVRRLTVVKGFRKREVEKLAKRDFAPGANVVTDGLSCWPAVEKAGCSHFPMVTGAGKRAANWAPFRWVNTTLGNIKTAIAGTYHHVSPKHAQHYLTSFAYRFNRRRQLDSIVERLAWAAVHTGPHPYGTVTADASCA